MADILQFRKPYTKPDHDTMRQVSRSETPSGFLESIKHIIQSQQQPDYWYHNCPYKRMDSIRLEAGQLCPNCFIDKYGAFHGRPDGAA